MGRDKDRVGFAPSSLEGPLTALLANYNCVQEPWISLLSPSLIHTISCPDGSHSLWAGLSAHLLTPPILFTHHPESCILSLLSSNTSSGCPTNRLEPKPRFRYLRPQGPIGSKCLVLLFTNMPYILGKLPFVFTASFSLLMLWLPPKHPFFLESSLSKIPSTLKTCLKWHLLTAFLISIPQHTGGSLM